MDLSHLTRPSILCQCSRCSSSLAACENEWAKLSNTYSTVAGWLSVDLNRINISSEKKQIPQSSELSFVRGCIVQEIMCRLCHQKLGALAHLENGVKIFWKLSKVSFREIISMRETQPVFKEGALPTLFPQHRAPTEPESTSRADPSATSDQSDSALRATSVQQQIQSQGVSINRISSSVDELHDTMAELKQAFTALRIELNAPGNRIQDIDKMDGGLDMVRTVLKELKAKADEIEKLRLENESLKLKNKYLEERNMAASPPMPHRLDNRAMSEVRSPGLLNENGKRSWPGTLTDNHHQQIADSFDDDGDNETVNHVALEESALPPVKVPLKPADDTAAASFRQLQNEIASWAQNGDGSGSDLVTGGRSETGEPANKRPRLSTAENIESPGSAGKEKKKPGRPKGWRKSTGQTQPSDEPQTPVPAVMLSEQEADVSSGTQREEAVANHEDDTADSGGPQTRSRGRRARSRAPSRAASKAPSRAPSASPIVTRSAQKAQDKNTTPLKDIEANEANADSVATAEAAFTVQPPDIPQNSNSSEKENSNENAVSAPDQVSSSNTRKSQVAARDVLAKMAMEREEAMATDG
ncbi:hypothetical protein VTN96DRAFT_5012 [Rasamsonia emersonii]